MLSFLTDTELIDMGFEAWRTPSLITLKITIRVTKTSVFLVTTPVLPDDMHKSMAVYFIKGRFESGNYTFHYGGSDTDLCSGPTEAEARRGYRLLLSRAEQARDLLVKEVSGLPSAIDVRILYHGAVRALIRRAIRVSTSSRTRWSVEEMGMARFKIRVGFEESIITSEFRFPGLLAAQGMVLKRLLDEIVREELHLLATTVMVQPAELPQA